MKSAFLFLVTIILFSQCQDAGENRSLKSSGYHRGIGSSIPLSLANEWIANCAMQKHSSVFRNKDEAQYTLTSELLGEALKSSQDVIGATFQNAIDSEGVHHYLFVPFIEGLPFRNENAPILDMNTGVSLSTSTAIAWTASYTEANPNAIRYYFFGREVLDEIVNTPSPSILEAVQGMTAAGEYKLVLLAHPFEPNTSGRSKGVETVAYDNSWPCPSTCAN